MTKLKAPSVPCGSCPYRKDVPSGIWARKEYNKLPKYDGEISEQFAKGALGVFMCHQRDGNLCSGWLACHKPYELVAIRLAAMQNILDPSVFEYQTKVPVFSSGAEARKHGIREIKNPSLKSQKMITGLVKKRKRATKGK